MKRIKSVQKHIAVFLVCLLSFLQVACGSSVGPTALSPTATEGGIGVTPAFSSSIDADTVTLYFDGNFQSFNLKDFAVALALLLTPDADVPAIQALGFDLLGLSLDINDITGAGPSPLQVYDLNGDGIPGRLEDFAVALAVLSGARTNAAVEQVCQDIFQISCNIQPGIQIPILEDSGGSGGGTDDPFEGTTGGSDPLGPIIMIVNGADIDGRALTVGGESVRLQATCRERNTNANCDGDILWFDNDPLPAEFGREFEFEPTQVGNISIIAQAVKDGRVGRNLVTFTVSPVDVDIADDVKVLEAPNALDAIVEVDPDRGRVCFQDSDELLVKIKRNDVVIVWGRGSVNPTSGPTLIRGDGGIPFIPPFKVGNQVTRIGDRVCFDGGLTFPDPTELIESSPPINWDPIDITPASPELISPILDGIGGDPSTSPATGFRPVTPSWPAAADAVDFRNPRPLESCTLVQPEPEVRLAQARAINQDPGPPQTCTPQNPEEICGVVTQAGLRPFLDGNVTNGLLSFSQGFELPVNGDIIITPPLRFPRRIQLFLDGVLTGELPIRQDVIIDGVSYTIYENPADRENPGPVNFPSGLTVQVEDPPNLPPREVCTIVPVDVGDLGVKAELENLPILRYQVPFLNLTSQAGQIEDPIQQSTPSNVGPSGEFSASATAYLGVAGLLDGSGVRVGGGVQFMGRPPFFFIEISPSLRFRVLGGLTLDALYRLQSTSNTTLYRSTPAQAPRVIFAIGPIPVWIGFYFDFGYRFNSALDLCFDEGLIGFDSGFIGQATIRSNGETSRDFRSYQQPLVGGSGTISGSAALSIVPSIDALLYDLLGIKLSLESEFEATTRPEARSELRIVDPIFSVLDSREPILLRSSFTPTFTDRILLTRQIKGTAAFALQPQFQALLQEQIGSVLPVVRVVERGLNFLRRGFNFITGADIRPVSVSGYISDGLRQILTPITLVSGDKVTLGSLDLPGTSTGSCSRIQWYEDGRPIALSRANRRLESPSLRSITLNPNQLTLGRRSISAQAFSPWQNIPLSEPVGRVFTVE